MTLKNSYSSYFKSTFKRKSWSTALSSLMFFLTLTLPALMMMSEKPLEGASEKVLLEHFNRICSNLTALMNFRGIAIKIAFVILAIIAGVSAFSHLHNKSKIDFYHSFPVSRKTMFACNFITSVIPVIIGFAANFILTSILVASFGYGQSLMFGSIYVAMAQNLLFFLCIFSVTTLCTILCGNTVITLILSLVALFGHQAIYFFFVTLKSYLYPVYYYNSEEIFKKILTLSPITQIFNGYSQLQQHNILLISIIYLIVTAMIIALSLFCFIKRKSEHSGVAIAFDKFRIPLKLYCCIILGLGFGVIFRAIVGQNIWLYFGIALGIILGHLISEITFDFSFSSIFKNYKHGIALLVLCIAVTAGMNLDITGFNTKAVNASQVESFGIYLNGDNYDYVNRNDFLEKRSLQDSKNIEAITEIIKTASACYNDDNIGRRIFFNVAVDKKGPGTFKRSYWIENNDKNLNLLNTIRYSEEYKKECTPLFSKDLSNPNMAQLSYRTTGIKNSSPDVLTDEYALALLKAMQEDYLSATYEQIFNKTPLISVEFDCNKDDARYDHRLKGTFPIYDCYSKTLSLLKDEHQMIPKIIVADSIEKVVIRSSTIDSLTQSYQGTKTVKKYNGEYITFDNKTDIEKIINNASNFTNMIDQFGKEEYSFSQIMIYYKGDVQYVEYDVPNNDIYNLILE